MYRRLRNAILALLPALMLYLAWPPRDLFILVFFAFIPWLFLEDRTRGEKGYFFWLYLGMLCFNLSNTWWVWHASAVGSVFMVLANSLLMTLPFLLYRKARRSIGMSKALFALGCYWLGFEYLHLNWEITWPWLSLGNVFAKYYEVVQWYEFTGMQGGSLWIWIINALLFKGIIESRKRPIISAAIWLCIPVICSIWLGNTDRTGKTDGEYHAVIVQPNIDPYKKFNAGNELSSVMAMLQQMEDDITDSTDYVILPETAIVEYMDEDNFRGSASLRAIRRFIQVHPHIHFITGASTYNFYDPGEPRKPTVRRTAGGEEYESYNTALEIDSNGIQGMHHKSKLVPGVEKMPYPKLLGFLEVLSIDMGGVSGSLGSDDTAVVLRAGDKPDLAPMICYESVFPDFVRSYVQKGTNIILVMTNDGWWKDTDGYKQHKYYASLRAIENRREVLRSANTGISCHIDAYGRILQETEWWVQDELTVKTRSYSKLTFFAKNGNYVGRFASFFAIALMLSVFVKNRVKYKA